MIEGDRQNTVALWCAEADHWRPLPGPKGKAIFASWKSEDGHLLFVDTGSVLRTRDFVAFEEYLSLERAPDDVEGSAQRLLLLRGNSVFEYERGRLSELQPALPASARPLSLSLAGDMIVAFASDKIWIHRNGQWTSRSPRL